MMRKFQRVFTSRPGFEGQAGCLGILFLLIPALLSGCVNPQTTSRTPRTSVEQLLLTQAVSKSLADPANQDFPLPPGASIKVDLAGLTEDRVFIRAAVEGWLGKKGYHIRQMNEPATYRVHLLVNAIGTEEGESFFGLPPVQSAFIPISLPEVTVFRVQRQMGRVQYFMNIFDEQSDSFIMSSPWYEGQTYHHQYTLFIFFSFLDTDLRFMSESPPDSPDPTEFDP